MSIKTSNRMRTIHRYLGFFLAGIMAIYALSGIVLIFRDSSVFKMEKTHEISIAPDTELKQLGEALHIKRFEIDKVDGEMVYFAEGVYNQNTGEAKFTTQELPYFLDKMTHLHKAKSSQPLFILNILFGFGLLFFVISAFWMFMPGTNIFRKGLLFAAGGVVLALVLLFI